MLRTTIKLAVKLLFCLSLFNSTSSYAQLEIKGSAKFKEKELPGMNIFLIKKKDTIAKTISNFNGNFEITARNNFDKIIFQFTGFIPIKINNPQTNMNFNIIMYEDDLIFIRYADKKAERKNEKERRKEFYKKKRIIYLDNKERNLILKREGKKNYLTLTN